MAKPITTKISRYVALALFAPSLAFGAGLGKLTVLSGLGQPLNAEIEVVSLQPGERESLQARLAALDAFRQANIELSPAIAGVQTVVERRPQGRTVIKLTSGQPVNEPFLDLLVELSWASGKLVREYTFLLDPVEYKGPQAITAPTVVAAVAPVAAAAAQPVSVPKTNDVVPAAASVPTGTVITQSTPSAPPPAVPAVESAPAPAAPVAAQPITPAPTAQPVPPATMRVQSRAASSANVAAGGTYQVQRGDTLGKIARENLPAGVTLEQMLAALYRANEGAFINRNMNLVRAGRTLTLPDADTVRSMVSAGEARQVVSAHTREWNEYKAKLAAAVAAAPAQAQGAAGPQVSGRITPKVEERSQAGSGDELRIANAGAASGVAARTARQDDSSARDKAIREANERVTELEKNIRDLQQLVEMKNQQLAQLQQQAQANKPAEAPKAEAPAPAEAPKTAPGAPQPDAVKTAEPAKSGETAPAGAAPAPAPAPAVEAKPAEPSATETKAAESPAAAASTPAPAPEPAKPVEAAQPAEPVKAAERAPVTKAPAVEGAGIIDTVTDNPLIPAGALALLAALGGLVWWRRKKSTKLESSLLAPVTTDSSSVFGSSGGRSIDTASALQTDFSQSGIGAIDTDEVDPVAEADVYMAYGRDAQAEEILKEALQKDPTRQAVRLKLLEIYAARKDLKAFESTAAELYAATGGQGADWEKAAVLGRQLDPANTMFSGMGVSAGMAAGAAAVAAGAAAAAPVSVADAVAKLTQPAPSIDFDLDSAAPVATPDLELDPVASGQGGALDLGLDLDLGAKADTATDFTTKGTLIMDPATKQALADAERTAAPSDLGLSIDFELPDSKKSASPAGAASEPEFDLDLGEPTRPAAVEKPVDLSAISFDLGAPAPEAAPAPTDARWQEVATKLDLAKAYEEMGDKDGARELLAEVLKEGDAAQQQQAKTMLGTLG